MTFSVSNFSLLQSSEKWQLFVFHHFDRFAFFLLFYQENCFFVLLLNSDLIRSPIFFLLSLFMKFLVFSLFFKHIPFFTFYFLKLPTTVVRRNRSYRISQTTSGLIFLRYLSFPNIEHYFLLSFNRPFIHYFFFVSFSFI